MHRLLRDDRDVKEAIRGRFGERAFGADGEVDRRAVGRIVFGDRGELEWLEALLHPRVVATYLRWRDEVAASPSPPTLTVTEVTASTAARVSRTVRPDVALREQRLIPDAEKLRRADFAFTNDGSLEELDAFVRTVVEAIEARHAAAADG